MIKFVLALALVLFSAPAWSQNTTCPTRPPGDSSNACASTAFVTQGVATNLSSPPPIGNITPNTGLFTVDGSTGNTIIQGNLDVTNTGADASTLYNTTGYGYPNLNSGFFTSGSNFAAVRYFSTYSAEVALYLATTQGSTIGETGLQVQFNVLTGYKAPSGGGEKAAMQISANCASGGGQCWDAAMSQFLQPGWQGASGNFATILELDPTNNAVNVGGPTQMFGLWVAGGIGLYPITSAIQVSPAAINGAVFEAYYGINITGATTVQGTDIQLNTHSDYAIFDQGTHAAYGIDLAGTYSLGGMLFEKTDTSLFWTTPSGASYSRGNGAIGFTSLINGLGASSRPVNSGSCAITSQFGGVTAGGFKASGACAGGSYLLTFAQSAPLGWTCFAEDTTVTTDTVRQTASTTNTVTFVATTADQDFIQFSCTGY